MWMRSCAVCKAVFQANHSFSFAQRWSGLAHHSVVEFSDLLIQSVAAKIECTTGISVLKSFGTDAQTRRARLLATGRDLNYSLPANSVSS